MNKNTKFTRKEAAALILFSTFKYADDEFRKCLYNDMMWFVIEKILRVPLLPLLNRAMNDKDNIIESLDTAIKGV